MSLELEFLRGELQAQGISFRFTKRSPRLDIPVFRAGAGVHHIVGLNGSGKSTLVKILSGVLRPDRGVVTYAGLDVHDRRTRTAYYRASGYLWQEFSLKGRLPVLSYLEYRGWLHGLDPEHARESAERIIQESDLHSYQGTPIGTLSGGVQRRVGIAAETLHRPSVLLLDEPGTGLDFHAQELIHRSVDRMVDHGGIVVSVSHDPAEMSRHDSTVHVMAQGTLARSQGVKAGDITGDALRDLVRESA